MEVFAFGALIGAFAGGSFLSYRYYHQDSTPATSHAVVASAPRSGSLPSVQTRAAPKLHGATFAGLDHDLLLAPLRKGSVDKIKLNGGGTSLSFRIDFDNGARAAFKPRQYFAHSQPRREIAAYRVSRLLGLDAVPPAVGRKFSREEFFSKLDIGPWDLEFVYDSMLLDKDGGIRGELSFWIPTLRPAVIDGFSVDVLEGIVTWKRYLAIGGKIPMQHRNMARQLSNVIAFDFIINNADRWTGNNLSASADNSFVYFIDNTMSFGDETQVHDKVRMYLTRSKRFSRTLVSRLRSITPADYKEALTSDIAPFDRLVSEQELEYVVARHNLLLDYIDELIATHGVDEVLVFP